MITVEVKDTVSIKFGRMSDAVRVALRGEIVSLTQQLAQRVKAKLSGQVLNKRSGRLYNSVQTELIEDAQQVYGQVSAGKGVPYAKIHEYGGRTKPHVILPKNGKVLRFVSKSGDVVFATRVNHPGSLIPERSYMRSSLTEMRDEIVERLTKATVNAAKAA